MKIQIVSDLHLDFGYGEHKAVKDRDLLVIAGDLAEGTTGFPYILDQLKHSPVLYVPGNHEYYGGDYDSVNAVWSRIAADTPGLTYLHRGHTTYKVGGKTYRFVCSTLWSNFWDNPMHAQTAGVLINDFQLIKIGGHRFTPDDCTRLHSESVQFLHDSDLPVDVVVTHFAPSVQSIHPQYNAPSLAVVNPYFCNRDEGTISKLNPKLWIHGHTHASMDYVYEGCRVVCNPRGYRRENREFDPGKVVVLGPDLTN